MSEIYTHRSTIVLCKQNNECLPSSKNYNVYIPSAGCIHMMSSLLGIHCSDGSEHVATVSPTRTRSVSQE